MDQISGVAGQLEQGGLYWILSALIIVIAAVLLGFVTGKFLFAREVEPLKEQLRVANELLTKADNDDNAEIKAALERLLQSQSTNNEEYRLLREAMNRLEVRYERENWAQRSAGGGGGGL